MTLELDKLTAEVQQMAMGAYQQRQQNDRFLEELLEKLRTNRVAWEKVWSALETASKKTDPKWYRAARPLDEVEPLDVAAVHPLPPAEATVIAADGSQILPDRHAAYLYSVINVGLIVYYHGRGRAPSQETRPLLDYPNGEDEDTFVDNGAIVNLRRDLAEIQTLVDKAWAFRREERPVLALLDQRLLYWPVGSSGEDEGQRVLRGWQEAMIKAKDGRCLLAGYIVRPGKRSVITMLETLGIDEPDFDLSKLEERSRLPGVSDASLFARLLNPGERSKVFVEVSHHNRHFAGMDEDNEVCFFYLNPGRTGRSIARVDLPIWAARDPEKVKVVHGLVYNQCQIMGDYPYVLSRADELAVVGSRDRESLEVMIANAMEKYGMARTVTAKASGKTVARAGRTRHEGLRRR